AWSLPAGLPPGAADAQIDALLRLARRSASSGAALAGGVAEASLDLGQIAAPSAPPPEPGRQMAGD
ncbi:MAG: hypothetical protein ACP5NI_10590, partial [Acetobacteraceae bacterium]